jgi:single stranded DNA-binding protein
MSASAPAVNNVTLVGHLTADPVLKQLADDRKVCALRLAVNDQKGQPPLYIDVATFGSQADACAKYLAKGRAIAVTGRLVYREWEDDSGNRHSRHHVIGRVQFGGRNNDDSPSTVEPDSEEAAAGADRDGRRPVRPAPVSQPAHGEDHDQTADRHREKW